MRLRKIILFYPFNIFLKHEAFDFIQNDYYLTLLMLSFGSKLAIVVIYIWDTDIIFILFIVVFNHFIVHSTLMNYSTY